MKAKELDFKSFVIESNSDYIEFHDYVLRNSL